MPIDNPNWFIDAFCGHPVPTRPCRCGSDCFWRPFEASGESWKCACCQRWPAGTEARVTYIARQEEQVVTKEAA